MVLYRVSKKIKDQIIRCWVLALIIKEKKEKENSKSRMKLSQTNKITTSKRVLIGARCESG
eukprot:scaffold3863_cov263-Chaetoceros_neogracile.AAC.11